MQWLLIYGSSFPSHKPQRSKTEEALLTALKPPLCPQAGQGPLAVVQEAKVLPKLISAALVRGVTASYGPRPYCSLQPVSLLRGQDDSHPLIPLPFGLLFFNAVVQLSDSFLCPLPLLGGEKKNT